MSECRICGEPDEAFCLCGRREERPAPASGSDRYVAADGKHYWNCWTYNYQRSRDGYCQHAFCEEDRTSRTLCGVISRDGGGLSIPNDLDRPSCQKCKRVMEKRGVLAGQNAATLPQGGKGDS